MRLRKIAAVGLLALTATVASVGTASAENDWVYGAYGYHDPNRHMFGIGDTEADGQYPYVQWKVNGVSQDPIPNYNGKGSWRDEPNPSYMWGQSLAWRICRSNGACSRWHYETV
ncbi:hypothetical protein ACIRS1_19715 [Kitasatospora sp. NPDC101176]|uniref:hypothetical protein n=1 Tax=Kitasatospora sp. NPDC101176 TaxID=3364099 RepID=UPI003816430D